MNEPTTKEEAIQNIVNLQKKYGISKSEINEGYNSDTVDSQNKNQCIHIINVNDLKNGKYKNFMSKVTYFNSVFKNNNNSLLYDFYAYNSSSGNMNNYLQFPINQTNTNSQIPSLGYSFNITLRCSVKYYYSSDKPWTTNTTSVNLQNINIAKNYSSGNIQIAHVQRDQSGTNMHHNYLYYNAMQFYPVFEVYS